MSIVRRPADSSDFINAAPDGRSAAPAEPGVRKGKRRQITHTIDDGLLARVDAAAAAASSSRASWINIAIHHALEANQRHGER